MRPGRAVSPAESRPAGVEDRQAQPGERDPGRGSWLVAAALLPQQAKLSTLKHTHTETHTHGRGCRRRRSLAPHTH